MDTRNGQTARALLGCTELCGVKILAYESLSRYYATRVIRDVDTTLTDAQVADKLRSPENRFARL